MILVKIANFLFVLGQQWALKKCLMIHCLERKQTVLHVDYKIM